MKSVLVTRPIHQAAAFAAALQQVGLRPILFPTVEIRCVDGWSAPDLSGFAGVFFTSVNAVRCLCPRLRSDALACLRRSRIWAVGRSTAAALAEHGIGTEPLPVRADADHLMAAIDPAEIAGRAFLFVRGTLSLGTIPAVIAEGGGRCTELTVYANRKPSAIDAGRIRAMLGAGEIDCLSFTSPSTADNFFEAVGGPPMAAGVRIAAIGETTAAALRRRGLSVDIMPAVYDGPSLVRAIAEHFSAAG